MYEGDPPIIGPRSFGWTLVVTALGGMATALAFGLAGPAFGVGVLVAVVLWFGLRFATARRSVREAGKVIGAIAGVFALAGACWVEDAHLRWVGTTTTATVLSVEVEVVEPEEPSWLTRRKHRRRGREPYPRYHHQLAFDGHQQRVQLVKQLDPGAELEILYDPSNPADLSVLSPEVGMGVAATRDSVAGRGKALAFIILAFAAAYGLFRWRSRPGPGPSRF